MSDTILGGDFTVFYATDNNQKRIEWTGLATGTRTLNELYSALQNLFDEPAQMDDLVPFKADTPDIYRIQNQWFIDDETVEHLTGGSLFSENWVDGTTEHVLVIGLSPTTNFDAADIGRTILGATTLDTGTLLDFNHTRQLAWIRPVDPATGGDEFDNATESYTIQNDPFDQVWQVDETGPTFVDETTDANDVGDNDWEIFPAVEAVTDYVAFGFDATFSKVIFDNLNGVAGVGGVVVWEYWSGAAWTTLAGVTDGTSGFTAAVADGQELTYTVPSDWARQSLNGSAQLYYIRARITTVYTTNPVYDQGFVGGVGAGAFASHLRHGAASSEGESAWVGISTIGTIQPNTHIYIFQESPDQAANGWIEDKLIATKGTSDWWADGQLDILIKTKEADSIFGKQPAAGNNTGIATILARQYSKTYSHFIATALATAGGNTVVPLSTGDDLDNTSGVRQMVLTDSAGNWNIDDRIRDDDDSTIEGVILSVSGSNPTITLQYYLIGDPLNDFTGATGTFANLDDTGTATAVAPTDVGPALDTTITVVFGDTTEDINNGNGARPYSVRINPAGLAILRLYERMKFISRRGSTEALQGQDGEEYVGGEIQLEYSGQAGGEFTEGNEVTQANTNARGVIVADHPNGALGDLILKAVRGTFNTTDTITEGAVTASVDSLRTITPTSAASFGTFAGGNFFGAPGVTLTIANLLAGEEQSYQLIDDDGTTQVPPNTVSMTVTNLISGDTVAVFRRTGTPSVINKTQFTMAAGNNEGDATVVVNETIASDNPTNANSKIRVISGSGDEHRYRYDSFAGSTFTLAPASTGTADGGSSNTVLIDAAATFIADEVEVGDYIRNTTDGFFVRVVSVDSETQITTEDGGATWNAKVYSLNTLVESYVLNDNAYVPYIERIADVASEGNQLVHTSDVDVRVDVRNAGVILPFTVDTAIVSTGLSTAAIRAADDIFT